ncbi:MAG TPA: HdeD family acid-resistance protein [Roseiarcus sp.]|nr:HdeD family acid-resistance protein [Roseiarcus sp.]
MTVTGKSPPSLGGAIHSLRGKWGWIVAIGVVYLIAGLVALGNVVAFTFVSAAIIGIVMIVAGVVEVISAFQIRAWGRFLLWVLLGLLYAVAGYFVLQDPILAAGTLTLLIGVFLVAAGVMRIILAFSLPSDAPRVMVCLSGAITVLLGAIILAHWPVSGLYTLGVLLGVDLVFSGLGWISTGMILRRA